MHQDHGLGCLFALGFFQKHEDASTKSCRVTVEGFRALQSQIEALQEQMRRGMNFTVKDESEDEREEGQVN